MTITDEEWGELSPESFDTTSVLRAVDELHSELNGVA